MCYICNVKDHWQCSSLRSYSRRRQEFLFYCNTSCATMYRSGEVGKTRECESQEDWERIYLLGNSFTLLAIFTVNCELPPLICCCVVVSDRCLHNARMRSLGRMQAQRHRVLHVWRWWMQYGHRVSDDGLPCRLHRHNTIRQYRWSDDDGGHHLAIPDRNQQCHPIKVNTISRAMHVSNTRR